MVSLKGNMDPGDYRDARQMMIRETNAFLAWATTMEAGCVPRIPTRRVDEGGFAGLLRTPAARAVVNQWWADSLDATIWTM